MSEVAFDGDPATEWNENLLSSLVVDMGSAVQFSGFVYTPGADQDLSGTIYRYDFAVSQDGVEWTEVVNDGEFSNIMHNPVPYEVHFSQALTARYFRLTSLQEINGSTQTSVGEIGLLH